MEAADGPTLPGPSAPADEAEPSPSLMGRDSNHEVVKKEVDPEGERKVL